MAQVRSGIDVCDDVEIFPPVTSTTALLDGVLCVTCRVTCDHVRLCPQGTAAQARETLQHASARLASPHFQ